MTSDSSVARSQKHLLALSLLIALITIATFSRCIRYPFLNWDDRYHIIDNQKFSPPTIRTVTWFWRHGYGNLYCPLTYTLFAGEMKLSQTMFGARGFASLDPAIFHLAQIALHAASAVMVFFILRKLFQRDLSSFFAAIVFAIHPLQVESLAWISETRGILAGFFTIAAILLLLHARWILAGVVIALALLSKPSASCAPLIALVLIGFVPRANRRAYLIAIVPWFLLAGAMLLITRAVQNPAEIPLQIDWWRRPIVALDGLAFYLSKIIVPINLAADYGRTPGAVLHGEVSRWIVSLLLVPIAILIFRRRDRAAVAVFIAALAPVLGLFTFHYQIISTVADRYAYLALLGVAMIVARFPWKISAIICLALATLSIVQIGNWRSDEALWSRAVQINPNGVALNNLAFAEYQNGKLDESIATYRRALLLDPNSQTIAANLDDVLADQSLRDSHEEHAVADWIQLGLQLTREQEFTLAGAAFRKAIALDPKNGTALNDFGLLRIQQGRFREAIPILRRAVELMPDNPKTRDNLKTARRLVKE